VKLRHLPVTIWKVEFLRSKWKALSMNVVLRPETQRLLEEFLKTGEYQSADEVLHAALEALISISAEPLDEETLDALDIAEDQLERGEFHDWQDVRLKVFDMFTK
jgi:Arc/MetJ-type ribon-helix-helix transcriptional regulator